MPHYRLFAALLLCAAPFCASAAKLPEPRALIDRHLEAVGGKEAMRASSSASAKLTMEIVENGMRGDMRLHSRPDAMSMSLSIAGLQLSMGMRDGVSWMIDPMHGPRLLEGEELKSQLEDMSPEHLTYDESAIESMETTALSDSEGRPCYRVEIVWKSGNESMSCFGTEDGLLLAQESASIDPTGETRELVHMYDYKVLGGLKQPTRMRTKSSGVTMVLTLDSYDPGNPPDDVFALPPAIAALLKGAQNREAGKATDESAAESTKKAQ